MNANTGYSAALQVAGKSEQDVGWTTSLSRSLAELWSGLCRRRLTVGAGTLRTQSSHCTNSGIRPLRTEQHLFGKVALMGGCSMSDFGSTNSMGINCRSSNSSYGGEKWDPPASRFPSGIP